MQVVNRENGFEVWYQPIFCIENRKFCSMEALIRLIEPDGTIISPGEFIPIAEQTGMVKNMTWFVLEESCRMLQANPSLDDVSVSINLPMAQLLEDEMLERINAVVDGYGIKRRRICFEFTERAILENFEQIRKVMNRFAAEGYRFFLDDFGAGYSNFNCLFRLPFRVIKLDMHLIRMDIDDSGSQRLGVIKTLARFLKGINMVVIAEGVETVDAARTIADLGIDRIQGYVYAKPMSEKKLLEFYKDK
jgi:EAL domain-containing protein (putative c-di-GMP-specific phosphodiesterase class I)